MARTNRRFSRNDAYKAKGRLKKQGRREERRNTKNLIEAEIEKKKLEDTLELIEAEEFLKDVFAGEDE